VSLVPQFDTKSPLEKVQFLKAIPAQMKSKGKARVELIDESQATNHLNHGYELLAIIPSGKLLIQLKDAGA
jgi:hypothetical protein